MRKLLLIGLCCGLVFVLQAFGANEQQPKPVRAVHFVLRSVTVDDAKRMADLAWTSGFNTLIFELGDAVQFTNFPGQCFANALTKGELLKFVQYARELGLDVVPEINLLTHQEKFFGNSRSDLMFNSQTYDPRKPEVYQLVFAYIDEIIVLLHPSAILIGHDEVAGHNPSWVEKWLFMGEAMLPAELFLQDVLRLHDYLKNRGIETWMWGDMLISPEEFPEMLDRELHGGSVGYGNALRAKLPKDIVICDWHYSDDQPDFPSLAVMQKEGFRVIGATWKKPRTITNFSRYAAQHHAYGMMATTWFHVQRNEWNVVERIIRESGAAFRKDFPDAK